MDHSVPLGGSIPPLVVGSVHGEVEVQVTRLAFVQSQLERDCFVRFKWWGQNEKDVSLFHPLVCGNGGNIIQQSQPQQENVTCVWYPVRSTPSNLVKYLHDCSELEFDVIDATTGAVLGQTVIRLRQKDTVMNLDKAMTVEGTFPVQDLVSHGDEDPLAILDITVRIGMGQQNSSLLRLIGENAASASPPIRVGPTHAREKEQMLTAGNQNESDGLLENSNDVDMDPLMTSFELNELMVQSDVNNILPAAPPQETVAFHPKDGVLEALGSSKKQTSNRKLPKRKPTKPNLNALPKEQPRQQPQQEKTPRSRPVKIFEDEELAIASSASTSTKSSLIDGILLRAERLKHDMEKSLTGAPNTKVAPMIEDGLEFDNGDSLVPLTIDTHQEQQSSADEEEWIISLLQDITSKRVANIGDPVLVAMQPVLAAASTGLQAVETASLQLQSLEMVTMVGHEKAKEYGWRMDCILSLPRNVSPFDNVGENSNHRITILQTVVPPFHAPKKQEQQPQKLYRGRRNKETPTPVSEVAFDKPNPRRFPVKIETSWPVTFDGKHVNQWMNGKLVVHLYYGKPKSHALRAEEDPAELAPVAIGELQLRQVILSETLAARVAIRLVHPVNRDKQLGHVNLEFSLGSKSGEMERRVAMKRALMENEVFLPEKPHPTEEFPQEEQDGIRQHRGYHQFNIADVSHISQALDQDVQNLRFQLKQRSHGYLSFSFREHLTIEENEIPKPLILEAYDPYGTLVGLIKVREGLTIPFQGWADLKNPFTGTIYCKFLIQVGPPSTFARAYSAPHPKSPTKSPTSNLVDISVQISDDHDKENENEGKPGRTDQNEKPTKSSVPDEPESMINGEEEEEQEEEDPGKDQDEKTKDEIGADPSEEDMIKEPGTKIEPVNSDKNGDHENDVQHVFVFEIKSTCWRKEITGMLVEYVFPHEEDVVGGKLHTHQLWWDSLLASNNTVGRHLIECSQDELVRYIPQTGESIVFKIIGPQDGAKGDRDEGLVDVEGEARLSVLDLWEMIRDVKPVTMELPPSRLEMSANQIGRAARTFELPIHFKRKVRTKYLKINVRYLLYEPKQNHAKPATKTESRASEVEQHIRPAPIVRMPGSNLEHARAKLCLQIGGVSKLQSLARIAARERSDLTFLHLAAAVGLNPSISLEFDLDEIALSFRYDTNILARTFDPKYNEEAQVSLFLDQQSIQALNNASLLLKVWHHQPSHDPVLIGECLLQLRGLFLSESGIHGAFPLKSPLGDGDCETESLVHAAIFFDHHRRLGEIVSASNHRDMESVPQEVVVNEEEHYEEDEIGEEEEEQEEEIVLKKSADISYEDNPVHGASSSPIQHDTVELEGERHTVNEFEVDFSNSCGFKVVVESAIHLPMVQIGKRLIRPFAYVSYTASKGMIDTLKSTPVSSNGKSCSPIWNDEQRLHVEEIDGNAVQFQIWHRSSWESESGGDEDDTQTEFTEKSSSPPPGVDYDPYKPGVAEWGKSSSSRAGVYGVEDVLLGTTVVDLSGLRVGLGVIHGWYHIIDREQRRVGQLKVRIEPSDIESVKEEEDSSQRQSTSPAIVPSQGFNDETLIESDIVHAIEKLRWVDEQLAIRMRSLDQLGENDKPNASSQEALLYPLISPLVPPNTGNEEFPHDGFHEDFAQVTPELDDEAEVVSPLQSSSSSRLENSTEFAKVGDFFSSSSNSPIAETMISPPAANLAQTWPLETEPVQSRVGLVFSPLMFEKEVEASPYKPQEETIEPLSQSSKSPPSREIQTLGSPSKATETQALGSPAKETQTAKPLSPSRETQTEVPMSPSRDTQTDEPKSPWQKNVLTEMPRSPPTQTQTEMPMSPSRNTQTEELMSPSRETQTVKPMSPSRKTQTAKPLSPSRETQTEVPMSPSRDTQTDEPKSPWQKNVHTEMPRSPPTQTQTEMTMSPSRNTQTEELMSPSRETQTVKPMSPSRETQTAKPLSPSRETQTEVPASPSKQTQTAKAKSPSRQTQTEVPASPSRDTQTDEPRSPWQKNVHTEMPRSPPTQTQTEMTMSPSRNTQTEELMSPSRETQTVKPMSPSRETQTAKPLSPSRETQTEVPASPSKQTQTAKAKSPSRQTQTEVPIPPSRNTQSEKPKSPPRQTQTEARMSSSKSTQAEMIKSMSPSKQTQTTKASSPSQQTQTERSNSPSRQTQSSMVNLRLEGRVTRDSLEEQDIEEGEEHDMKEPPSYSTFYNQLGQNPRRSQSSSLPSQHICTTPQTTASQDQNDNETLNEEDAPKPSKHSWMDPETARIARILKGL